MDPFDQLIELANEAKDGYEEFLKSNLNPTMEQADENYRKSKEICKSTQEKLDGIKMSEDRSGCGYGYDRCVYYRVKDILNMHEYLALLIFMSKLRKKLSESTKRKTEKNLGDLIAPDIDITCLLNQRYSRK
jgi:hypothetical protein